MNTDTLIPTNSFRWYQAEAGDVPRLQQMFQTTSSNNVWRNVPTVRGSGEPWSPERSAPTSTCARPQSSPNEEGAAEQDQHENRRLLSMGRTKYSRVLYAGDNGMWTVIEITERPIAHAPSASHADRIIEALKAEAKP